MRTAIFGVGALGTVLGAYLNRSGLEVDGINGAISAYGRKVGCPTPMNDKVVSIVHAIEDGRLKPEFGNLELFYS